MTDYLKPKIEESSVACPSCNSTDTEIVEEKENLRTYKCSSCNETFTPAMESRIDFKIKKWGKIVRLHGNNDGQSWRA